MTDDLSRLLIGQYEKYPLARVEDMLKLIYQNEFGCGHMISDPEDSLSRIQEETGALPPGRETAAAEPIGNGLCRVPLRVLRDGFPSETLNRLFVATANRVRGSAEAFEAKAAVFQRLCGEGFFPFDAEEVSQAMADFRAAGYPPPRHSEAYRSAYAPSYRVIESCFFDYFPLFSRIDVLMGEKKRVLCAVDGPCASGKTTLAETLRSVYDCRVFSMDDFFLRPSQRTAERLAEPGGNVDYERFRADVLEPLSTGEDFSYRPYDCAAQALAGEVTARPGPLNVVEGVYSLHPSLSGFYDLTVFLEVGRETQQRRLMERSAALYDRFEREWIPMERAYFQAFEIPARCDLIFQTTSCETGRLP